MVVVDSRIEAAQHLTSDEPVASGGSAGPLDVNISAKSPKYTTNADALVMMAGSRGAHAMASAPGHRQGWAPRGVVGTLDPKGGP